MLDGPIRDRDLVWPRAPTLELSIRSWTERDLPQLDDTHELVFGNLHTVDFEDARVGVGKIDADVVLWADQGLLIGCDPLDGLGCVLGCDRIRIGLERRVDHEVRGEDESSDHDDDPPRMTEALVRNRRTSAVSVSVAVPDHVLDANSSCH